VAPISIVSSAGASLLVSADHTGVANRIRRDAIGNDALFIEGLKMS
jgi:hypothetical protein